MTTPRSIAMLGWALPALGASEGSGYNLNAGELAAGLVARGHRVSFLRSGMAFSFKRRLRICSAGQWRGVVCHEVLNSPIIAPAYYSFGRPASEHSSPQLVAAVMGWLDSVRAEVVHVHSLEGFTHDVMGAIAASGRRLVITLHNHWFVCPQVDLFYRHAEPCTDYDGGRKCETCTVPPAFVRSRLAAAGRRVGERVLHAWTQPTPDPVKLKLAVRWLTKTPSPPTPIALGRAASPAGTDDRLLAANGKLVVLNAYGDRRRSALAAVAQAHRVLVPSAWMQRVAVAFGVDAAKVAHIRLGQPHFDQLAALPRTQEPWRPGCGRPLEVAFLGSGDAHKGLQVLADAIEIGGPLGGGQNTLSVRVRTAWLPGPIAERLKRCPEIRVGEGYGVADLPNILASTDVVVYPQICYDNSPLVVMEAFHAGVPVIASDLGGPRSLVTSGANGLLVRAGDSVALRDGLESVLSGAWLLPNAAAVRASAALPRFDEYVSNVEREYDRSCPDENPQSPSLE